MKSIQMIKETLAIYLCMHACINLIMNTYVICKRARAHAHTRVRARAHTSSVIIHRYDTRFTHISTYAFTKHDHR